jgi:hypothetical protein
VQPASTPGRSRLVVWAAIVGLLATSVWFFVSRDRAVDVTPEASRSDTTVQRNVPEACRDLLEDPWSPKTLLTSR